MGRLLNPGIGEYADRLTILQLKITRAAIDANVAHFREELAQIFMRLERTRVTEEMRQQIAQLRTVNTELWELEDAMAGYARPYGQLTPRTVEDLAQVAVEIWRANRKRNQIIAEINRLAGTDRGPEKL